MPIHKIQRELRANKPKLICSALHCAVWEIIVIKAFNCNTLLTFSALPKVKLNAMLFLYCLWCQYYACWTNKHNLGKINNIHSYAVIWGLIISLFIFSSKPFSDSSLQCIECTNEISIIILYFFTYKVKNSSLKSLFLFFIIIWS